MYDRPSGDGAIAEVDEGVDNRGLVAGVVALVGGSELRRDVVLDDED